jgi:general secretion pathway protein J
MRQHQRGFTLFEILIAVFILGIISVIMLRGLQTVISSKEHLERNSARLAAVDLTMSLLASDIGNLVNRPVVDADNITHPALILNDDGFQTLELTRGGVGNPLAELRSTQQRVEYQLKDGALIRLTWPVLDRVKASEPSSRVLLTDVSDLQWQFLGPNNNFSPAWPSSYTPLPKAIKVSFTIAKWGTVSRLFLAPNIPAK